jgi:predicted transcriptional regulator
MSIKEEIIKIIKDMPETITIEDVMQRLYVRAKIEAGLKELDEGKGIPHEEAMERMSKWLN